MIRILGVDPGLSVTGYGVIEADRGRMRLLEAGVVRTRSADKISSRLKKIKEGLTEVVKEYRPRVLVLEKIYSHYKHPVTSILMGHARGVACLVSAESGIELVNYPSTRIKKAIAGSGHASKPQIQGMVKDLLRLKKNPEPLDVSDALALAMSYVYIGMKERI